MDGAFPPDINALDTPTPRKLNFEEALNRQLDRIAYLRSNGGVWSEAVYQLRDMVVGFEDAEFFDGVPDDKRKGLDGLLDPVAKRRAFEAFQELGWDTVTIRAFRSPRGPIFRPTAEQLSRQLRILMRLLDRQGFIRKTRRQSSFSPPVQTD